MKMIPDYSQDDLTKLLETFTTDFGDQDEVENNYWLGWMGSSDLPFMLP
jgi:hypothetical protein